MTEADQIKLMKAVAKHFFGEPNEHLSKEKNGELRFGTNGSKSVDLKKGRWFDHETNKGGGPIELIKRETGISETHKAYTWAEEQGYWVNGGAGGGRLGREVAAYDYTDDNGQLLYQAVRFEPKDFRQRRPNSRGGWIWNVKDVRQVPYRLPELIEAIGNEHLVFIVEGEKDVDRLRSLGVPATTNAGGASKWRDELNPHFKDADAVIAVDNDKAGRDHGINVASKLRGIAKRLRVLDLSQFWPQCPNKGDISDWFDAGHRVEEFNEIVAPLPDWSPQKPIGGLQYIQANELKTMLFDPIKTVVPGILIEGLTLLAGKPKAGK
jgi:hypothetical protein